MGVLCVMCAWVWVCYVCVGMGVLCVRGYGCVMCAWVWVCYVCVGMGV